jgi:serine phosphatase RsbU (regulator of sigma subunit)/anti-sigma regulatory factor (Ser/Thr protein kinase)
MRDNQNFSDYSSRADRLAQIINMVEATALRRGKHTLSKTILGDLYRALLPESVPDIPGWAFEVYYRPADILSADFYDFIPLTGNKWVISIGDVAGKGSSVALQMAKASNLFKEIAPMLLHPAAILTEVNQLLYKENNQKEYVTCFFAVLDPISGEMEYANAGHLPPYKFTRVDSAKVEELFVTGKPLGIFPNVLYDENRIILHPGDAIIFLSDGLLEARNQSGEMFFAERLISLLEDSPPEKSTLAYVIEKFNEFLGENPSQQDDITLIYMVCQEDTQALPEQAQREYFSLLEFSLPSVPGNERLALNRVVEAVQLLPLSADRLENLNTAMIEAVRNAIHHGNHDRPELPVTIAIRKNDWKLSITVTDSGSDPVPELPLPDLQAKLSGKQSPFGWGLFLIQQLVDEIYISSDANHHTIEMIMYLDGV